MASSSKAEKVVWVKMTAKELQSKTTVNGEMKFNEKVSTGCVTDMGIAAKIYAEASGKVKYLAGEISGKAGFELSGSFAMKNSASTETHKEFTMPAGSCAYVYQMTVETRTNLGNYSAWDCNLKMTDKPLHLVEEWNATEETITAGTYWIRTAGHYDGRQPPGWGLACFPNSGAKRNDSSTWVAVHEGEKWPCKWAITPGTESGTWRIKTCGHAAGQQPTGWGLCSWHSKDLDARRNDSSSRVAVHSGDKWPCDWKITPGTKENTWRITTCSHIPGQQPAGWGLACFPNSGAKRNGSSTWVHTHAGDKWPCDWYLEKV